MRINFKKYDYNLPKELIAKYPPRRRGFSRLMVVDRKNKTITHTFFHQIVNYLTDNDLIVRNATKVIPARLFGERKQTAGKVEILPLSFSQEQKLVPVLLKTRGRLSQGEIISFPEGKEAVYLGKYEGIHQLRFNFDNILDYLYKYGQMPLPPYIKRKPEDLDKMRYQTIYAKYPGSIAAPTAGLHFSSKVITRLKNKGIKLVDVNLQISYATFKPVTENELESKKLYKEYFEVSRKAAEKINQAREKSKRIVAVGTTTVRVLESNAYWTEQGYRVKEAKGETDLFIYPPYKFKIVDVLITNFHLPKSSLLLLVSAFCGRDFLFQAYKEAIQNNYRFYSYGDCMLII